MALSKLQTAMQSTWQRLDPNLSNNVLAHANALIAAFEQGEICLDLASANLEGVDELKASSLIGVPGEFKPIIKDGNYLYLARYFAYQKTLAEQLLARLQSQISTNQEELEQTLKQVFADDQNLQYQAAKTALSNNLAIIAGGPGTGKTTTVVKILAAMLLQNPDLKIGLAAPTGKAAARMSEAILAALPKLEISDELKGLMPYAAQTLHRLLGSFAGSPKVQRTAQNPLNLDVLIVDEASMLDLALMAKLLDALPLTARLILLGDAHQLSAVEAGAIFGDLCRRDTKLASVTTHLQVSHRFKDDSAIGNFVAAVKEGQSSKAINLLAANPSELSRCELDFAPLKTHLIKAYQTFITCAQNATNPADVFAQFGQFRALCAHNEGKFGANYLNQELDFYFSAQNSNNSNWYAGKAIMILRNDYNLQLFNGDIGICLTHKDANNQSSKRIFFESENGFKSFVPTRLPQYTGAFALTVHKSQGSEFTQVAVILPDGTSELINRSMLYTAVTRAKKCATIWASADAISAAINNYEQDQSPLVAKLS